MSALSMVKQKV